jgi:hypothetical protein
MQNTIYHNTDWLGFNSVFYNRRTKQVSPCIHDLIDYSNLEFDNEGLRYFVEYGYSAFGLTPIKDIHFLQTNETLKQDANGDLTVSNKDDFTKQILDAKSTETETVDLIRDKLTTWLTSKTQTSVILPLSGGLDSRFLACLLPCKEQINAFTYGISKAQNESFEVIRARAVATRVGIKWQQIKLGNFHDYINQWLELYGPTTHAHGMYHIEFYENIKKLGYRNLPLLSGIIGDAWAGSFTKKIINTPDDITSLAYNHGVCIPSDALYTVAEKHRQILFFETNREYLDNVRWQTVASMRKKIILLSYLIRVPTKLGFSAWSPFLDLDVVKSMLSLPDKSRENRKWQRDFLEKFNLGRDIDNLPANHSNSLDLDANRQKPLPPLDVSVLREIVREDFVDNINKLISRSGPLSLIRSKIGKLLLGERKELASTSSLAAYNSYVVLKPLEQLLLSRNRYLKHNLL